MCNSGKENALNAVDLLNDFVGDFITGTMVLARFYAERNSGSITAEQLAGINKMCLSHLVIGLAKWTEFYDKFHDLIPRELKDTAKRIKKTITTRNVVEFRNKCVGHILDKETNRTLVNSEILERLEIITDHNVPGFLRWLNNPNPIEFPNSVAGISEAIRDRIATAHGIISREAIER